MSGLGGNRAVLMERTMAWSTAQDGDGTRLLLVAAGGGQPGKAGRDGPGLPSPSLPARCKTN